MSGFVAINTPDSIRNQVLRKKLQDLAEKGKVVELMVRHDEGCPTLESCNAADCTCEDPEVVIYTPK